MRRPEPPAPAAGSFGAARPLAFEANVGQADARARFVARGKGFALHLAAGESWLVGRGGDAVHMRLLGARSGVAGEGLEPLPGRAHYFRGPDPAHWRTNVPLFGKVRFADVRPGVDLVYYGREGALEYDLVLAPGIDHGALAFAFDGVQRLEVDTAGDLVVTTPGGRVAHTRPRVFERARDGSERELDACYALRGERVVGFELSGRDPDAALVIDPVIVWATYLGGSNDESTDAGLALDSQGNVYVAGTTLSIDYPVQNPLQGGKGGGNTNRFTDVFVTKFDPTGTTLVYSTYLGGAAGEQCHGIAVDAAGSAYIAGSSAGADFPTTGGSFQPARKGLTDAFVAKLDPTGAALSYSTYLGGSAQDNVRALAIDANGNAYVAGETNSSDFPVTAGAFQGTLAGGTDAFVAKLDAAGSALVFSTYLGTGPAFTFNHDTSHAIAIAPPNVPCVLGRTNSPNFPVTAGAVQSSLAGMRDYWVVQLDPLGGSLLYSTYLGGSKDEASQGASRFLGKILADAQGDLWVVGETDSPDFPTTAGALQTSFPPLATQVAVVARIDPGAVNPLVFSTYLGGKRTAAFGAALDPDGSVWAVGLTNDVAFPVVNPVQPAIGATTASDAFVSKLSHDGTTLLFSTYLGGTTSEEGIGVAIASDGDVYVAGGTDSPTFPVTPGAFSTTNAAGEPDLFIAKLDLGCPPPAAYGAGTAGTGAIVPTLTTGNSPPLIGNKNFQLRGAQIRGGALCLMLVGVGRTALPVVGITLNVNPLPPLLQVPLLASGTPGTGGAGSVTLPLPLPPEPLLGGLEVDAQLVTIDPAGPRGFAASAGLAFVLCNET